MQNHQESGFTLIELMIVIAIIGILAAIAIPRYAEYLHSVAAIGVVQTVHQTVEDVSAAQAQSLAGDSKTISSPIAAPEGYTVTVSPAQVTPTSITQSIMATPAASTSATLREDVSEGLYQAFGTQAAESTTDPGLAVTGFSCPSVGTCIVTVSQRGS